MQPENSVDRLDLGRLDQARMRDHDGMQRPLDRFLPEGQEAVQLREIRAQVVILLDIGLQQPRMIGAPVQDLGGGQAVAFHLTTKVLRGHANPQLRLHGSKSSVTPSL